MPQMGYDTKTDRLIDCQSQCDSDSEEQSRGLSHKWQRDKSQQGFQKFLVSSQPMKLVLS
jgi:hypothetical protein